MRKILIIILAILLSTAFWGCSRQKENTQDNSKQQSNIIDNDTSSSNTADVSTNPTQKDNFIPEIGGIARGDAKEKVLKAFGSNYITKKSEGDYSLGEPFSRWIYGNNKGISVIIGNQSGKVLEIETTSPNISTNLGYKVGDIAKAALTSYEAKYNSPASKQDNKKLTGWFLIRDQELVVFNYGGSGQLVNGEIKPDSKITRILLSNFDYMD